MKPSQVIAFSGVDAELVGQATMTDRNADERASRDDDPTSWFEPLYRETDLEGDGVPWANMETHPSFRKWLARHDLKAEGRSALVVGCGMGDDAVEVSHRGFATTAFDVSPSAIEHCQRRFPDESVQWHVADLFTPPADWDSGFDFVLEIYTVQSLPPRYEAQVIKRIARLVREGGQLLVIAIVSQEARSLEAGPPWVLTPSHIEAFGDRGLAVEDHFVHEGGARRGDVWVTTFYRPSGDGSPSDGTLSVTSIK